MIKKNVVVKIPGTCVVNSKGYVYLTKDRRYDKEKKYNVPDRVCIGKSINKSEMYPNENYDEFFQNEELLKEAPELSDTVSLGLTAVVDKIIDEEQIDILLDDVFTEENRSLLRDLIVYMIYCETSVIQHFPSCVRRIDIRSSSIHSDSYISKFFKEDITDKDVELFLNAWNMLNRKKDVVYVSYDSTNMNTWSKGIEIAEYGHAKVDEGTPQVNLSLAINQKESLPLLYELYPGSINDVSQLKHMVDRLKEYGYTEMGIILDRGYFSKQNIEYIRRQGYDYLLMVKTNNEKIDGLIKEYRYKLPQDKYFIGDHNVYGTTKKMKLFDTDKEEVYVHLYFDSEQAAYESKQISKTRIALQKELAMHIKKHQKKEDLKRYSKMFRLRADKEGYLASYTTNDKYIKEESERYGFFCIVTSQKMSCEEALSIYRDRDTVEKLFMSLKSEIGFNRLRIGSSASLRGKAFIVFLATIIRSRIYYETKKLREKNKKEYTIPAIINELMKIEVTKNAKEKYVRRYALTAKQKNILNCFELNDKDIDKSVNRLNNR